MTPVNPQIKTSNLIKQLIALEKGGRNELQLKRIENEAIALLSADEYGGNVVLGMVASNKLKHKDCINHFENAIAINDDFSVRANYALALKRFFYYSAAYTQICIAIQKTKNNPDLYMTAIPIAFFAGCPEDVLRYHEMLNRQNIDLDEHVLEFMGMAKIAISLKLKEGFLSELFKLTESVRENIDFVDISFLYSGDEESATCIIQTELNVEQVVDLNIQFCDMLSEKELDPISFNRFNILFRAA